MRPSRPAAVLTALIPSALALAVWAAIATSQAAHAAGSAAPSLAPGAEIHAIAVTPTLAGPAAPLTAVNGIPISGLVVMDDAVRANIRAIHARGAELGNDMRAFSAIGDSSIAGGQFLERFGKGPVVLGDFGYLEDVIAQFTPSFTRTSTSVRIGLHSWSVLNPAWADKRACEPNETVIACEFRLNKPGVVFIRLGANDSPTSLFDKSMRRIIEVSIEGGVIPILITKANAPPGAANAITNGNNDILRQLAGEYKVPLIDFDQLAQTLPQRGLGADHVHMTGYAKNDFTLERTLRSGHAMHNLAALIGLDAVWREMRDVQPGPGVIEAREGQP